MNKQGIVILYSGQEPNLEIIESLAGFISYNLGVKQESIIIQHYDSDSIAKAIVRNTISHTKSGKTQVVDHPKTEKELLNNALFFIKERFANELSNTKDPNLIDFSFKLKQALHNAKARIAFNPSVADAEDKALINAIDIICDMKKETLRTSILPKKAIQIILWIAIYN